MNAFTHSLSFPATRDFPAKVNTQNNKKEAPNFSSLHIYCVFQRVDAA